MPMQETVRKHFEWLHNQITGADMLSGPILLKNARFNVENIRKYADLPPETDRLLEQLLSSVNALAVALRQFALMGQQGQAPIEAARNAALQSLERLRPALDRAEPSELARALGIS